MIDPRGSRFAAALTTIVLTLVLLTGSPWLLAAQALAFAVAVGLGPAHGPYGLVFARFVRPRLSPPTLLEDARAPRFAQGVGLLFSMLGLMAYAVGAPGAALVAVAAALAAAFLNAAFGICLGCEIYLAYRRLTHRTLPGRAPAVPTEVSP